MTKYNTGNPVGSADPRDLYDTATVADKLVQGADAAYPDRLGVSRRSWKSVEAQADQQEVEFNQSQSERDSQFAAFIAASGYEFVGDYAAGIEITGYQQVVRDTSGEFWRASGSTTLPYTTTGAGLPEGGAFVAVGDAVLRQDLVQPVATYNNVADMKVDGALGVGRKARTLGYYAPGDGGGNDYEIVAGATGTADGGSFIDLDNGLQAKGLFSGGHWVEQFGVKLNGTQSTNQFSRVIDYITTNKITFKAGAGTILTESITLNGRTLYLSGQGKSSTFILLDDGQNTNAISLIGNAKLNLHNIAVDQNRANNTAGHAIRSGGCDEMVLNSVKLQNAVNYGIGIQAGTTRGAFWEDLEIENTGLDGIDIKDSNNDNEIITISGYTFRNIGLDTPQQAGLDFRGPVNATNIYGFLTGNSRGIRNRRSGPQGRAGFGTVKGVVLETDGVGTTIALDITGDNSNLQISDVVVDGLSILINQEQESTGATLKGISAKNLTGTNPNIIKGTNLNIIGITAENTGASSRIIDVQGTAVNARFSAFNLVDNSGNPSSVRVQSGANSTKFINGTLVGGSGGVADAGTKTRIINVEGHETESSVLSNDILVDSIGNKAFIVPHNLKSTPGTKDVQLSLVRSNGNPIDYDIAYLHVESTSSTSVSGRLFVSTASGTAGAAVRVAIRVVTNR